jgi:hypothetical protein
MKLSSPEKKSKRIVVKMIVTLLFGAWLSYAFWAVGISARTVLMPEVPEWQTYLLVSSYCWTCCGGSNNPQAP